MNIENFIDENKETYNYCEAIIFPNGEIDYANPSHTYRLLRETGKSMDEISEIMPISAGPVAWLVDYTNCVAVWYNFGMLPENCTDAQEETIERLREAGLISKGFVATKNFEMKVCDMNQRLYSAETKEEIENVKKEIEEFWQDK